MHEENERVWYLFVTHGGALSDGTPTRCSDQPTTKAAAQLRADELNREQDPFGGKLYSVGRL